MCETRHSYSDLFAYESAYSKCRKSAILDDSVGEARKYGIKVTRIQILMDTTNDPLTRKLSCSESSQIADLRHLLYADSVFLGFDEIKATSWGVPENSTKIQLNLPGQTGC